jgi:hypothetical protein
MADHWLFTGFSLNITQGKQSPTLPRSSNVRKSQQTVDLESDKKEHVLADAECLLRGNPGNDRLQPCHNCGMPANNAPDSKPANLLITA